MNLHIFRLPKLIAERRSTAILGMIDHRHAVGRHHHEVFRERRQRPARSRANEPEFRDGVRGERAALDRRDRQGPALPAAHHRDAQGIRPTSTPSCNTTRRAERDHRPGRDHRRQGHHPLVQRRTAVGAGDQRRRPGALQGPPQQHRGPAVHQQAGGRPCQRPVVGAVHPALLEQRRQRSAASSSPRSIPAHFTTFYDKIDLGSSGVDLA